MYVCVYWGHLHEGNMRAKRATLHDGVGMRAQPLLNQSRCSPFAHPEKPRPETNTGLIYYLPEAAAHRLLASVGQLSAPGSVLAFDFMNKNALVNKGKGFPGWMITAKAS